MYNQDLVPKNPEAGLQLIGVGRLSKPKETEDRTQQTMAASCEIAIKYAKSIIQQPMNIITLVEQSSGLVKNRRTMLLAKELIAGGTIDLVVCEDLSRIYRNPCHQMEFVQYALDQRTHVISVNDGLDTRRPGWETILGAAVLRHGTVVSDTQYRVKRSADDAFQRGGFVTKVRFGYIKLSQEEAKSGLHGPIGLRVAKDAALTPVIKQMIGVLKQTGSFARVGEWCSENKIPYGPYQTEAWQGDHAKLSLSNPMLGGYKTFRVTSHRRLYGDGTVLREKNPNPDIKHYPELAHLSPEDYEELQQLLEDIHNTNVALRNRDGHRDKPVIRKDVLFPAQHACCGICEQRLHQFGKHVMKCPARVKHLLGCFNRVQFDQVRLRHASIDWLLQRFADHPAVIEKLLETAIETHASLQNNHDSKKDQLLLDRETKQKRVKKLGKLILDCDDDADAAESCFQEELKLLTKQIKKLDKELQALENLPRAFSPTIDPEELRSTLPEMLKKLSDHSREFSDLLRKIFPAIHIRPIQAIDSTQIWPRAFVTFNPSALMPFESESIEYEHVTIDVFTPSSQYQCREDAATLLQRFPDLIYEQLGRMFGTSGTTIMRAVKLHNKMLELGLIESPNDTLSRSPSFAFGFSLVRTILAALWAVSGTRKPKRGQRRDLTGCRRFFPAPETAKPFSGFYRKGFVSWEATVGVTLVWKPVLHFSVWLIPLVSIYQRRPDLIRRHPAYEAGALIN